MKRTLLSSIGAATLVAACGGSVVFVDDGEGGAGGSDKATSSKSVSGSKSASGSKSVTSVSSSNVTTGGSCELPDTTLPATCDEACSDLFDCGLLVCQGFQLCGALIPSSEENFMMFCRDQCKFTPALISIVDPGQCDVTVDVLSMLSSEFNFFCHGIK